jgi:transcriptional antiterminator NusG
MSKKQKKAPQSSKSIGQVKKEEKKVDIKEETPKTSAEEKAVKPEASEPEVKDENIVAERGTGKKKIPGHIIINKKDDSNAKWYVVHTTSGHEVRVAETLRQRVETMRLEDKIFEILVPTQDRVVIRSGKKQNVKEKIFPGYMLVKLIMDDPTWLAVRTTPGITGFVGAGKTPTPLSDSEVKNIQKFISTPAKRFKTKFSKGEAVKITDGPFSDFLGSIDEIDEEKGKVKVLVSIFGRETPVELDLLQITKV